MDKKIGPGAIIAAVVAVVALVAFMGYKMLFPPTEGTAQPLTSEQKAQQQQDFQRLQSGPSNAKGGPPTHEQQQVIDRMRQGP